MKYKVGDKVKIISMEEVRSYSKDGIGMRRIGELLWIDLMDRFCGDVMEISRIANDIYFLEGSQYGFSPEMIEGPAEVEQEQTEGEKIATNITCGMKFLKPEPEVEQEGEKKTWTESEVEALVEYLVPGMNSMVLISDFRQLTRKNNPQ